MSHYVEIKIYARREAFDKVIGSLPLECLKETDHVGRPMGRVWIQGIRGIAWLFGSSNIDKAQELRNTILSDAVYKDNGKVWLDLFKALSIRDDVESEEENENDPFLTQ